jgi:DNA-binding NarL/FixJ family response regulator
MYHAASRAAPHDQGSLISGGRQTVNDSVLAVHRVTSGYGARRLSTAGPLPSARPVSRWHLPSAEARVTRRERQVLALLAEGHSTREVAQRLAYSERTIKNVLQEFTTRLQLRNRTQAVAYAVRRGWI